MAGAGHKEMLMRPRAHMRGLPLNRILLSAPVPGSTGEHYQEKKKRRRKEKRAVWVTRSTVDSFESSIYGAAAAE